MGLFKDLWEFMRVRKKFWLTPILIVLVVMSSLILLSTAAPALMPFIYPFM